MVLIRRVHFNRAKGIGIQHGGVFQTIADWDITSQHISYSIVFKQTAITHIAL